MRFMAQGPDIPLELLEARDRGEVIFLCGAGVSMPAGLPSFSALALRVLRQLRVPPGAAAETILSRALTETDPLFAPPMDQVFGTLQRDYGAAQVEAAVARALRAPPGVDPGPHKTILRLSTDRDGQRRLVTTNFDSLFSRADPSLPTFAPPNLPDLASRLALRGVVHLHGRSRHGGDPSARQGLVLATADFGRAYLSDGWATRFIQQLLSHYTLVLLGYSADDPPVRYLLEGLHAGGGAPSQIYTFTPGPDAASDARWRARGVHPIAYEPLDDRHAGLWESLEAWAQRADDPEAWRTRVISVSQGGQRFCNPMSGARSPLSCKRPPARKPSERPSRPRSGFASLMPGCVTPGAARTCSTGARSLTP